MRVNRDPDELRPAEENPNHGTSGHRTLWHYTDAVGQRGIILSHKLWASLKERDPRDARYGNGQYLSDLSPGTKTCAQLSACFLRVPWRGERFTHYVEVDVTGLTVVTGRMHVLVVPGQEPLDLKGRIVSWGTN
jgi:HYD1 signature containing ADP-ribosyltransferase